jgi:hypothetical protein
MYLFQCIENVWWRVVYGAMQYHFFDILGIEYSNWKVAIDIRHSLRFLVFYIFMVLVSAKLN